MAPRSFCQLVSSTQLCLCPLMLTSSKTSKLRNSKQIRRGRLLVVEDDLLMSEWICSGLGESSIETYSAASFSEVLSFLDSSKAEQIHGIVSDIYLGTDEPDGMKVVSEAKRLGLPVAVITSKANFELAKEALNHGACALLEKPFRIEQLVETFENLWEDPPFLGVALQRFVEKSQLTEKESDVCRLLFKGLSNAEIAGVMGVSEKTVKFHVSGIFSKCQVKSRSELLSTVFPV